MDIDILQSNNNSKENIIKNLRQALIEADRKIDELNCFNDDEKNKYNILRKDYESLLNKNTDYNVLIYKLEDDIYNLKNKIKILEENKKKTSNDLTKALLENDFKKENEYKKENKYKKENENLTKEIISLQKIIEDLTSHNKDLETQNIKLDKDINSLKIKNLNNEINLEDELYIIEKQNNIEILKNDIQSLLECKKKLELEIFELKSILQMFENKKNKYESFNENKKKKFCCFL